MKLNRRNFLKGLGLSSLGLGLFRFKPEENETVELSEIVEVERDIDKLPDNYYACQANSLSHTSTIGTGQTVYISSNNGISTMTIVEPDGKSYSFTKAEYA